MDNIRKLEFRQVFILVSIYTLVPCCLSQYLFSPCITMERVKRFSIKITFQPELPINEEASYNWPKEQSDYIELQTSYLDPASDIYNNIPFR